MRHSGFARVPRRLLGASGLMLLLCGASVSSLAAAVAPTRTAARPGQTPAKRAAAPATATAPLDLSAGLPAWRCPDPVERTLANGLRVVVFQNARLPLVQIQLLVPAGVLEEGAAPSGLAYLTSQLLRQGTSSRDAAAVTGDLDRLGGNFASAASRDYATVVASFLARDFDTGLELVSDIVINPILSEDDLGRLKTDALRSLAQLRTNLVSVADEQIWSLAFSGTPYGRAPFGQLESVKSITRDDVRAFYRDHWRPDQSVLLIGGDVTPERAFSAAKEWFERWSGKVVAAATATPARVPAAPRIRIVDQPDAQSSELRFGLVLPGATSGDDVALSLATSLLASGPASRLQTAEVRRRFGRDLRSTLLQLRDGGLFTCGTTVRTDSAGAALRFLRAQLREFIAHPPAAAELEGARRVALQTYPIPFETMAGLMSQWMGLQFLGQGRAEIDGLPARIAAVQTAGIADVAKRWLDPDHAAIVVVGPADKLKPQLEPLGSVEVVRLEAPQAGRVTIDTVAATPERLQHGRQVLDQALVAHGGLDSLRGIHDSISDADITLSSGGQQFSGHLTQTRKEPYRMAYFTRFETLESTQILDGLQAWSLAGGADAVEDVDSVGVVGLRASFRADLPHLLIDAAAPGSRVVYHGEDRVGTTDVDVLDVTQSDGGWRRYGFDRKTHLLFVLDELGAGGGSSVASRRLFRDYRTVQGIHWPFVEERLLDNEPAMRMQIISVKLNSGVNDKTFARPRPAPASGP